MKKIRGVLIMVIIALVESIVSACGISDGLLGNKDYDIKLYSGIMDNNLELMNEALEDGANINKIEVSGMSESNPIWIAIKTHRDKRIIEYLINRGADVNYRDEKGQLLLSFYAYNIEVDFCELLIKRGAKVNEEYEGDTALEYALGYRGGDKSTEENVDYLVTMFLEHGAKIRPVTLKAALDTTKGSFMNLYRINKKILEGLIKSGYESGLDTAVEAAILGESSKLDNLIKSNKVRKEDEQQILFYTAAYGSVETIKLLESKGIQLESSNEYKYTPLILASYYGNLDVVKYLVSKGVNIEIRTTDNSDKSALNYAAENNQYEVAEYLIKKGADVKPFALTIGSVDLLSEAAINGNVKMIKLILDNGYPISNNAIWTAILSARENRLTVMKYFLESGLDINFESSDGTLLDYAWDADSVKYLLDKGAKVNGKNSEGAPLRNAVEAGNSKVVEYLIKKGANVNAVKISQDGEKAGLKLESALMIAVRRGYFDIVKLLVENGADLEQQYESANYDTAIITASIYGRDILEYLIKKGANINYQNSKGETALMNAARKGWIDNVKVLMKYGTDKELKDKEGHTALYFAKQYKHKEIIEFIKNTK